MSTAALNFSALNMSIQETDLTRFTTWGNGVSAGRIIGEIGSLPGKIIEMVGASCQKVEWLPVAVTGCIIENIGSAVKTIGSLAGPIVTLLERLIRNIAQTLGGIGVATIGIFAAPFSTSVFKSGVSCIKNAWTSCEEKQQLLPLSSPERDRATEVCKNYVYNLAYDLDYFYKRDDYVKEIKTLTPPAWSSLFSLQKSDDYISGVLHENILPVYVECRWHYDGQVHFMFGGAGNLKAFSSAIASLVGIEDYTFRTARKLVQDFAATNPGKVHVSGISLGGALAQYAGISAGVPVTCFNSVALAPALIDKLVDWNGKNIDKIKHARVEHFNSKDDWVAQGLQSGYSLKWLNFSQLGQRYIIPEAYCRDNPRSSHDDQWILNDSHNPDHVYAALENRLPVFG